MESTTSDKERCEWQLCQLFKLQAELSTFTKQIVPAWNSKLIQEGAAIMEAPGDIPLPQKYADLWFASWKGSQNIILRHGSDNMDTLNWLLDKRLALRQNLCDYVKTDLPAMREALGENACYDAIPSTDELWRESWNSCMKLVSLNED